MIMESFMKLYIKLLFLLITTSSHLQAINPEIETKLGRIKGSIMYTRLGKTVYAFRGIYYAESPTGDLRFKSPVPIKPWNNIFDASEEGPACPQPKGTLISENCLTLNIYTKKIKPNDDKLPVIVYIHPGVFYILSGQSFLFGPHYLLDHDIVLVTINYRLGALGFTNMGNEHAPGNFGFHDQVAALQFVRDNIGSFGGDSGCVTLAGQSAGARSIILHAVSPLSKGLYHRAIALSGSTTTPIPAQREQIALAKKLVEALNCTTDGLDSMFKCLTERPAEAIANSTYRLTDWQSNPTLLWYPSIEPEIPEVENFLPDDIEKLMKAGKIVNDVPTIIGTVRDEYCFKFMPPIEEAKMGNNAVLQELSDSWEKLAPVCFQYERETERSRNISEAIRKFYFNNEAIGFNNYQSLFKLYADSMVKFPVHRAVNLLTKSSRSPMYYYEFAYPSPYGHTLWRDTKKPACIDHSDDLGYLFYMQDEFYRPNNFPFFNESYPEIMMVKRLTTMWAHFAKTGLPLPQDSELFENINWEPYSLTKRKYLLIDQHLTMKDKLCADRMKLWDELFP